jgi:hypothetical protein
MYLSDMRWTVALTEEEKSKYYDLSVISANQEYEKRMEK